MKSINAYAPLKKNHHGFCYKTLCIIKRFFTFRAIKIVSNVLLTVLYANNTIYYKVMKVYVLPLIYK